MEEERQRQEKMSGEGGQTAEELAGGSSQSAPAPDVQMGEAQQVDFLCLALPCLFVVLNETISLATRGHGCGRGGKENARRSPSNVHARCRRRGGKAVTLPYSVLILDEME